MPDNLPLPADPTNPHEQAEAHAAFKEQHGHKHYHSRLRRFFTAWFTLGALPLIFLCIAGGWVTHTIASTDTFTSTVSGLSANQTIQTYIAQRITNEVAQNAQDENKQQNRQTQQSLSAAEQQEAQQAKQALTQSLESIMKSSNFQILWVSTIQKTHQSLITQLDQSSTSKDLTLDFRPLLLGTISQLKNTPIGAEVGDIELRKDVGVLIVPTDVLSTLQLAYQAVKSGLVILLALTVALVIIAIILAERKLTLIRTISIVTSVACAITALLVSSVHLEANKDADTQQVLNIVADALGHSFSRWLFTASAIAAGIAVVIIIIQIFRARRDRPAFLTS